MTRDQVHKTGWWTTRIGSRHSSRGTNRRIMNPSNSSSKKFQICRTSRSKLTRQCNSSRTWTLLSVMWTTDSPRNGNKLLRSRRALLRWVALWEAMQAVDWRELMWIWTRAQATILLWEEIVAVEAKAHSRTSRELLILIWRRDWQRWKPSCQHWENLNDE